MEFMESDVGDTIQQQQKKQQQGQGQQQQQLQQQHFHVLAVDDSHIDMKLLEKLLRVSSYQVTCVDSGDKALAYLGLLDNIENIESPSSSCSSSSLQEGLKVNLIMTDYSMPGMNGYDLLKRLKGSTWKDVPVVIMSSENVPSRITMCLEGGAEGFLLKPLQLSDLEKLQSCLMKSLHHKNIENSFSDNKNKENENNYNNNSKGSINNNNNNNSKRKSVSPEPSERRPKMKELVVV